MKEKLFKKIKHFSFFIIIILFLFNLNIIKSQEDDEEEDKKDYYVHFDLSDPDIILIDKNNPNPELKDIISKSHSIVIPKVELDKEGFFFLDGQKMEYMVMNQEILFFVKQKM